MADLTPLPVIPWQTTQTAQAMGKAQGTLKRLDKAGPSPDRDLELKKACGEIEAQFIHHLFKQMRSTVPESGLLTKGSAEKIYTSMADYRLAEELAHKGGIGLSSMLYEQLSKAENQEERHNDKK